MALEPSPEELKLRALCEADPELAAALAPEFEEWAEFDRRQAAAEAFLRDSTEARLEANRNGLGVLAEWAKGSDQAAAELRQTATRELETVLRKALEERLSASRQLYPIAVCIATAAAREALTEASAEELLALTERQASIGSIPSEREPSREVGSVLLLLYDLSRSLAFLDLPSDFAVKVERLAYAFLHIAERNAGQREYAHFYRETQDAKRRYRNARGIAETDQLEAEQRDRELDLPPPPLETFLSASMPTHAPPLAEGLQANAESRCLLGGR